MKQRATRFFALVTACGSVGFFSTTASEAQMGYMADWYSVVIDGAPLTNGVHSLPSGWTAGWSGSQYIFQGVKSVTRKGNQSGLVMSESEATNLSIDAFLVQAGGSNPGSGYYLEISPQSFVEAEANTEKNGAIAAGIGRYGPTYQKVESVDLGPGDTKYRLMNLGKSITAITSWSYSGGYWIGDPGKRSLFDRLYVKARAYNNGGAGNYTVAYAKGVSQIRLNFAHRYSAASWTLASGSINSDPNKWVSAEPFLSGVSQGIFACPVASGSYSMTSFLTTNTYNVKYYTPGALIKAVSVGLTTSGTTTGANVTFKFGDLDGDNYVSQDEADYIYSKIGLTADFDEDDPYSGLLADFDGDGIIEQAEFDEADANVGLTGD